MFAALKRWFKPQPVERFTEERLFILVDTACQYFRRKGRGISRIAQNTVAEKIIAEFAGVASTDPITRLLTDRMWVLIEASQPVVSPAPDLRAPMDSECPICRSKVIGPCSKVSCR